MKRVNYNASFSYGADVQVLDPTSRKLVTPTLGQVTGVKLRLSLAPTGAAIDPTVDNLAASEASGVPGEFAYTVSQLIQQTVLAPKGPNIDYYAIWSGSGFDDQYVHYRTADSTEVI